MVIYQVLVDDNIVCFTSKKACEEFIQYDIGNSSERNPWNPYSEKDYIIKERQVFDNLSEFLTWENNWKNLFDALKK